MLDGSGAHNRPKPRFWTVGRTKVDPKSRIWTVGAQRTLCHCRLKRPRSTTAAPPPHHFTTATSQSPRRSATRLHCRADLPLPLLCLLLPRRSAIAYCRSATRRRSVTAPLLPAPYCRAALLLPRRRAALAAPLRYYSAVSLLPSHFDRHCMLLPHCAAPRRSATGASLCYCRAAQRLSYSPHRFASRATTLPRCSAPLLRRRSAPLCCCRQLCNAPLRCCHSTARSPSRMRSNHHCCAWSIPKHARK